jgi:hypothetical protein
MRFPILLILAAMAAITLLTSCTDAQIARSKEIADLTDQRLAQANAAVKAANEAVASAKRVAEQLGNEQALRIVTQAEGALAVADAAREAAAAASDAAHHGLDAAKEMQAAGGSTVGVVGAFAAGIVPGVLAAIPLLLKLLAAWKDLRQTVTGLDAARAKLGDEAWKTKVAPELAAHQDEDTRKRVIAIQTSTKAKSSAFAAPVRAAAALLLGLFLAGSGYGAVDATINLIGGSTAEVSKIKQLALTSAEKSILVSMTDDRAETQVVMFIDQDQDWILRTTTSNTATQIVIKAGQVVKWPFKATTTIYVLRSSADSTLCYVPLGVTKP